ADAARGQVRQVKSRAAPDLDIAKMRGAPTRFFDHDLRDVDADHLPKPWRQRDFEPANATSDVEENSFRAYHPDVVHIGRNFLRRRIEQLAASQRVERDAAL